MMPDVRAKMIDRVEKNEGFRAFPYIDSRGNLSVAFGRNLKGVAMSIAEGQYLLSNDIQRAETEAYKQFPDYNALNDPRKSVIVEMVYNMGLEKVLNFKEMIAAIAANDFAEAAKHMLNSAWAVEVGKRADELAMIMQSGVI